MQQEGTALESLDNSKSLMNHTFIFGGTAGCQRGKRDECMYFQANEAHKRVIEPLRPYAAFSTFAS